MNKNGLNQVEWVHDFRPRAEAQQNLFYPPLTQFLPTLLSASARAELMDS